MTAPEDPRRALAQYFLDNAVTGRNCGNHDLVQSLAAWQRARER